MFNETHDAILLILAAMWLIGYISQVVAFSSGQTARVHGTPLYIAAALVITAALW